MALLNSDRISINSKSLAQTVWTEAFCLLFNLTKSAGRQYEPNKSRQGGHKTQNPNKFQYSNSKFETGFCELPCLTASFLYRLEVLERHDRSVVRVLVI